MGYSTKTSQKEFGVGINEVLKKWKKENISPNYQLIACLYMGIEGN